MRREQWERRYCRKDLLLLVCLRSARISDTTPRSVEQHAEMLRAGLRCCALKQVCQLGDFCKLAVN